MTTPLPDFDVLVALYRHDPAALEDFRRHMLREAVDEAPLRHRPSLERLLDQIETARASAATPMDAALIAFRMMQDSVARLQDNWTQALEAAAGLHAALIIERLRNNSSLRAA
ncbi:DUF3135 domain-containing protein [Noviherbaspirillum sp. ST9]|uniref:DUF3135 domain-containing protein n=1 Tax=Noviherbaspirillum sp. ST9 TaxID=3401606 RepID=UPI003B588EC9